ncbi:hypothetical protein [Variovorax sp. E3]|uniref:hypothetical protein n=1 Tax=Variovorax sp. E3 TaxID=1914993 RepID=UPI0018DB4A7D|nr:hypothetical protein [Variovorax sp. E3]
MGLFQGINQLCLFPIAQALQVDASVFSYEFIRLVQEVVLQLQAVQVASEYVDLSLQFFTPIWLRRFELACHDAGVSARSSWFFQLYSVGLQTPSLCTTTCALSCGVHRAMTAACFSSGGRGDVPGRATRGEHN